MSIQEEQLKTDLGLAGHFFGQILEEDGNPRQIL